MKSIAEVVMNYKTMERYGGSMLREVKWQYAEMAEGRDGGSDGVGVEVEVGDQSQGSRVWSHDQDALGMEVFRQARDLLSRDGGEDHVGLYGRDFDAFDVGEAIGEEAGVRVAVLQAINVVLEGVDARRRQDA